MADWLKGALLILGAWAIIFLFLLVLIGGVIEDINRRGRR